MRSLSHVRIVMVHTTHPGNIGAAARAMKNMGLTDLALVAPKTYPSEEATARASGADDLLRQATVHETLEDAIADCALVVGASARLRSISWPQVDPRACAERTVTEGQKTAILFGRENSGLTNEELERCHYLLHIPTHSEYTSLNVASAIQVIAYELCVAAQTSRPEEELPPKIDLATADQMASFFGHLETVLTASGFLHERTHEESIMRRLRRIFNRYQLEENELHILRGILTSVQRHLPKP